MNGSGSNLHPEEVGPLSLSDFMERWATSMPGVETPSQDLLKVQRWQWTFRALLGPRCCGCRTSKPLCCFF